MRILSIDGGGYLGLASASFLEALEHRFNTTAAARFDLFCGTSTGAIIALALAAEKSASEIVALYEEMGPKVFRPRPVPTTKLGRFWDLMSYRYRARHDNEPLRAALEDVFQGMTLGDLNAKGRRVLVTAFSVSAGAPRIFKTDHAPPLKLHDGYSIADVAMASSAAPIYLPLVEIKDPVNGMPERFCDGGVVTNSPALLGYAEAVSILNCRPDEIEVLSLGTPRADLAERPSQLLGEQLSLNRGLEGWKYGEQIISLTIDGGSKIHHTALERIATASGARYERVDMIAPQGVGLDIATPEATLALRQIGATYGRHIPTIDRIAPFFL